MSLHLLLTFASEDVVFCRQARCGGSERTMTSINRSEAYAAVDLQRRDMQKLELLTTQMVEQFNTSKMHSLFAENLHTSFVAVAETIGGQWRNSNANEQAAKVRMLSSLNPTWSVNTWNVSSSFDCKTGLATVLLSATLTGFMGDFAREQVHQLKWKQQKGVWKAVEYHLLNGGGQLTTFFSL